MIGCSTRWPIEPTAPAMLTSACHAIDVWSPSPLSVNDVVMSISAPTPLPFARMDENSSGRSSSFSKSIDILRPAEAERDLHLGLPVAVVDDLEALDARHQAGHARRDR